MRPRTAAISHTISRLCVHALHRSIHRQFAHVALVLVRVFELPFFSLRVNLLFIRFLLIFPAAQCCPQLRQSLFGLKYLLQSTMKLQL